MNNKLFKRLSIGIGSIILALILIITSFQIGLHINKDSEGLKTTITIGSQNVVYGATTNPDYYCTGSQDYLVFQQALDALPTVGGELKVLAGTYSWGSGVHTVSRAIDNVIISGVGAGTSFSGDATNPIFSAGSQAGWVFRDFKTDNGGLTYNLATNYILQNITIGSTYYSYKTDGSLTGSFIGNVTGNADTATSATSATTATNQSGGTVDATQIKDDDLTSGRVVLATTDGQLTDDSDLSFSGDTLSATKVTSSSLTTGRDVVVSTGGLLIDKVISGSTFPVSPKAGDQFIHSVTGRKILYCYNGSSWLPQQALSDLTLYVDKTDGTDDLLHGTGVDANAFKTLTYAWNMLPAIIPYSYAATIGLSGESYTESLSTFNGESKTGKITIYGSLSTAASLTATGGLQGSGTNLPRISGTFSANEYDNKLVYFTSGANTGTWAMVGLTTTTNLYLIANTLTAAPGAGDTYVVYNLDTTITGNQLFFNCPALVYFSGLNLTSTSALSGIGGTIWAIKSMVSCQNSIVRKANNSVTALMADEQSLIEGYGCVLGSCYATLGGSLDFSRCKIYGNATNDGSSGVLVDRLGQANLNWVDISTCQYGVQASENGQATLYDASIYNRIHGCANGVYTKNNGQVSWQNTVFGLNLAGSADANTTDKTYISQDVNGFSSAASMVMKPSGDTDDYFTFATASNVPTIYGTGAYSRFGDAATTSHSLASEDDLMVTGKLEVDGGIYDDSLAGTSLAQAKNTSVGMPVLNTDMRVTIYLDTELIDLGNNMTTGDLYGASGAYRQADADSTSTTLEDNDASFVANTFGPSNHGLYIKWASDAGGTTNTGEGYAFYSDSDTLTLFKSSGADFAASYYYWIRTTYYTVPVSGYYEMCILGCLGGCEDGKRYNAGYSYDTTTTETLISVVCGAADQALRFNSTYIAHFTAGQKVTMWISNTDATTLTCYPIADNNVFSIRCIKVD